MMGMHPLLKRVRSDRSGASAVEFALIAPIMIALYFGLAEYCQAMMADRKVTHVSSAIGDLVAQSDQINTAEIDDIFKIGKSVLAPFDATNLKMRVSQVTMDANSVPSIKWTRGAAAAYNTAKLPRNSSDPNKAFIGPGESVIVAQAEYTYDSPVKYFIKSGVKFTEVFYLRPRKSDSVTCTNC
jgi:Flp pilus assembly protein TadG